MRQKTYAYKENLPTVMSANKRIGIKLKYRNKTIHLFLPSGGLFIMKYKRKLVFDIITVNFYCKFGKVFLRGRIPLNRKF